MDAKRGKNLAREVWAGGAGGEVTSGSPKANEMIQWIISSEERRELGRAAGSGLAFVSARIANVCGVFSGQVCVFRPAAARHYADAGRALAFMSARFART